MKSWLFWTIPIVLFILQLLFILNSQTQIRYEDLAESVRNVFWLEQGLVYDGVSSNVGWYGTLLIIYKLFGFHLHAAQFFKLALYLISMICLGLLLKKYINHFWLPFLVIGLSPTLLYYSTIQASHGVDLLYFPTVLFLVIQKRWWIQFLGWALSMWAWMSYPTFIFYLPALFFTVIARSPARSADDVAIFLKSRFPRSLRSLGMTLAFLIPLILIFIYVQNRSTLLYDPKINSGIFRGGGNLDFSLDNISQNLGGLVTDLFVKGSSYHFEVNQAEFSLIFPILTVALVFIMSLRKRNWWVNLALVSILAVTVVSSLTLDPSGSPGMRRYTPALAAFYTLFVYAWHLVSSRATKGSVAISLTKIATGRTKWYIPRNDGKRIGMVILSLLLIHHLIVYPINLIHLKDPSPDAYPIGFNSAETPKKSLDNLLDQVTKGDLKLVCLDQAGKPFYCRLAEVYAAVAGSCVWNRLDCHQILGWDHQSGQLIPLSTKLWDEYYFEH